MRFEKRDPGAAMQSPLLSSAVSTAGESWQSWRWSCRLETESFLEARLVLFTVENEEALVLGANREAQRAVVFLASKGRRR